MGQESRCLAQGSICRVECHGGEKEIQPSWKSWPSSRRYNEVSSSAVMEGVVNSSSQDSARRAEGRGREQISLGRGTWVSVPTEWAQIGGFIRCISSPPNPYFRKCLKRGG